MSAICQTGSHYLYDSCHPGHVNPAVFQVAAGESVILELAGADGGTTAVIEHAVGNMVNQNWQPLVVGGVSAELSADNTILQLDIPGTYRVAVNGALTMPDCTVISAESYRRGELIPGILAFPASAAAGATLCTNTAPVGVVTSWP